MWKLESPNGTLVLEAELDASGALILEAKKHGKTIVEMNPLCLYTDAGEFSAGLNLRSQERKAIHEVYSLPAGKLAQYQNDANELLLTFKTGAVRIRAYDVGLAFRYEVGGKGDVHINAEKTTFHFAPTIDTLYAQELIPTYERPYWKRNWTDAVDQPFGMPMLLNGDGLWMLMSEAQVLTNAQYCSCHLLGGTDHTLSIEFAREEHGEPLTAALPFYTPWRILTVAENLNELVQSHLCYDVNEAAALEDFSWVKPARSLWAWWEYENGAQLYSESKHYIDTAAAMGFEAVTLDCGWDANWVEPLCNYAHARGVQLWLWTGRNRVDTPESMEKYLPLWASWGIDGLKIDFFEDDSQHVMQIYRMLAQRMAELHLMINFHGSTKPMGEGRTWPHFMTAEGIMGLEHYKWSDMPNAQHNCTVPFTRNVSGPMDYTPVGFSNPNRNTTHAHQLALPVVFDSGVTHYALSVYHMEGWIGTRFLRRTKAHYDEIRLLKGEPGRFVAMLRRAGDEYFIGVITTYKHEMRVSLDFLPDGVFYAEFYEDDDKDQLLKVHTQRVCKDDELVIPLLENGGAAIYIGAVVNEPAEGLKAGCAATPIQEIELAKGEMHGGSEPMCWNDGKTGVLLEGSVNVKVLVPQNGRYTLRILYTSEKPWEWLLRGECGMYRDYVPATQTHYDFSTRDVVLELPRGESVLCLTREGGEVPALACLQVLDNHPQATMIYSVCDAKLGSGAELAEISKGLWDAVNLGGAADLLFDQVHAEKKGRYLLNVIYCGGESRDLSVEINGESRIDTYLHSTAGWNFPTWRNAEGKELLIELQQGQNQIRLFNDKGAMSHIRAVTLMLDE